MFKAILFMCALFSLTLFGQTPDIPDVDPLVALFELIRNWSTLTPIAVGMGLIVIIVQVIKAFAGNFKFARVAVVFLSVVYSALLSYNSGLTWLDSVIAAFVVGGGAVAIYEAWKGISQVVKHEPK